MILQVRPMGYQDIDEVYSIELSAHRAPWSRDIFHDCILVNYDCRCLVEQGTQGQTLLGYIICRLDLRVCHILNLCIAPSFQSKGHGSFLLKNYLDSLDTHLVDMAILEVRPSNLAALKLYNNMGFVTVGIKRGYYSDPGDNGEDAVVLQKALH